MHDEELSVGAPWYSQGRDWSILDNHRGIIPIYIDEYLMTFESSLMMSSKQLAEHRRYSLLVCWNTIMVEVQYNLDCPHLDMTEVEKDRLIWADVINLENKITQNSPTTSRGRKMALYKTLSYMHQRMDSSSGPLIWTCSYPTCCRVWLDNRELLCVSQRLR